MIVDALVEGDIDHAVAARLITLAGHTFGDCYGKRGVQFLTARIDGYAVRRRYNGRAMLVLVDLMDLRIDCGAQLHSRLLSTEAPAGFMVRGVMREIESWLLADQTGIANFLAVAPSLIPRNPESVEDPKLEVVNLARRSRRRTIRESLVPDARMSGVIGPGYTSDLVQFVHHAWRPELARRNADSLDRCMRRLMELPDTE